MTTIKSFQLNRIKIQTLVNLGLENNYKSHPLCIQRNLLVEQGVSKGLITKGTEFCKRLRSNITTYSF